MRAVFAAVLSVLAIAGGASMPAEAAPFGDLRTAGTHKAVPLVRLARVTFDDEFRPSRRGRVDARHWKRPGYAKQRSSATPSSATSSSATSSTASAGPASPGTLERAAGR